MGNNYKIVIAEKKVEASKYMVNEQQKKCNKIIHTAAATAAASGAVPVPGADALPISAVQVAMVMSLGKLFDQKVTESAAKGLVSATISSFVGRNLVKLIPVAGWVASAAVAAGVTEALGWTIAADFAKRSANRDIVSYSEKNKKTEEETFPDEENSTEAFDKSDMEKEEQDDQSMAEEFAKAFGMEEE